MKRSRDGCIRCGAPGARVVSVRVGFPDQACGYIRDFPWCEECHDWAVSSVQQWGRYFAEDRGDPLGPQPDPSLNRLPLTPGAQTALLDAAKAWEALEEHIADCEDCGDGAFPELCEAGFPLADSHRLLMRAAWDWIRKGGE